MSFFLHLFFHCFLGNSGLGQKRPLELHHYFGFFYGDTRGVQKVVRVLLGERLVIQENGFELVFVVVQEPAQFFGTSYLLTKNRYFRDIKNWL